MTIGTVFHGCLGYFGADDAPRGLVRGQRARVEEKVRGRWLLFPVLCLAMLVLVPSARSDEYEDRRHELVRRIEILARRIGDLPGGRGIDPRVTETMARVPRHLFVPRRLRRRAYQNRPLPIGYGQTISQPYIVALMTDLADPAPAKVALEIGTGSGYQAAVLADTGMQVYTMEIIEPLAEAAAARLKTLGYDNVFTRWGDGYDGWPEHAPFDAIIVTAAASHVPPPLVSQLKPGGRMVIPVGARFMTQHLLLVEKNLAGKVTTRQLMPVAFVPLTRMR